MVAVEDTLLLGGCLWIILLIDDSLVLICASCADDGASRGAVFEGSIQTMKGMLSL